MRNITFATAALTLLLNCSAAVRADDAADARAIVDKAIKAMGGADKIKKTVAVSSTLSGKVTAMGMELDIKATTYIQEPDRIRVESEVNFMGMDIKATQIFNKDKGWIVVNGMTIDMTADMIAAVKERLYNSRVNRLVTLSDKEYKLSTLGEIKVDGKDAVGVRVERKDRADVNLYFDKTTHLMVKTASREKDGQTGTEVDSENFLSDYKEIGGLKVPHKIKVLHDGKELLKGEISDQKFEDKLSDTLFEKP